MAEVPKLSQLPPEGPLVGDGPVGAHADALLPRPGVQKCCCSGVVVHKIGPAVLRVALLPTRLQGLLLHNHALGAGVVPLGGAVAVVNEVHPAVRLVPSFPALTKM